MTFESGSREEIMSETEIRTGFVTQTHTGDVALDETIEQGAAAGFDFVELYMDGATERSRLDADTVVNHLEEAGVDLMVHLPFVDLDVGTPRDRIRTAAVEELKACLEMAARLGAEKAVLHASTHATSPEWSPAEVTPHLFESVRELHGFAGDRGVEICVENLPDRLVSIHEVDDLLDETDASLTFDTGHARVDGLEAGAMARFLADNRRRVSHVHVNDSRTPKDEHVPTGSGTIDFGTALEPLRNGWGGTMSLEVFTFDFEYLALSKRKFEQWL